MSEQMLQHAMNIILFAGDARAIYSEAVTLASIDQFEQANQLIAQADESLVNAHKIQTELIQAEMRGEQSEIGLLMVHAQDHLMTCMVVKDFAKALVVLNEKIAK